MEAIVTLSLGQCAWCAEMTTLVDGRCPVCRVLRPRVVGVPKLAALRYEARWQPKEEHRNTQQRAAVAAQNEQEPL